MKKEDKKISERLNSALASLQPYGNWRDVKKILRQDAQDKGGKFPSLLLSEEKKILKKKKEKKRFFYTTQQNTCQIRVCE